MNELFELYQELILDHSRHPRHYGELKNATHQAQGINPLCGDEISIYIVIEQQKIQAIQFTGAGCAIALASASLLAEEVWGKTLIEAQDIFAAFLALAQNQSHAQQSQFLGKLKVFASLHQFPMRVKCGTLPWHTMKAALEKRQTTISTETNDEY